MFNVFLTIFLFVALFITWAMLGYLNKKLDDEIAKNDVFRKGMCQLHAQADTDRVKNMDLILKNFNALIDNADFENHKLNAISELLLKEPSEKPKKKTGRKKKATAENSDIPEEIVTESRDDLEKL